MAVPVLGLLYLPVIARRSAAARIGALLSIVAILAVGLLSLLPAASRAVAPTATAPIAQARLVNQVQARHPTHQAVTIDFSQPMDRASVQAALTITPVAQARFAWDTDSRSLSVSPATAWSADTYYSIAVGTGARSRDGVALGSVVRAIFVTAPAPEGQLSAEATADSKVATDSAFDLNFDVPVTVDSVRAALTITPAVPGTLAAGDTGDTSATFTFTPTSQLAVNTTYTLSLGAGVVDSSGNEAAPVLPLTFHTVSAPAVVRFRPLAGTTGVDPSATVSVRFTMPMNTTATAAAFSVTAAGKRVSGALRWAENDTVLVLTPSSKLPYGAKVVASVSAAAKSKAGTPIAAAAQASFTVVAKPATTSSTSRRTVPISTGGSAVGGAPWYAAETYYLRLMNCTRTGGWVTAGGACGSSAGLATLPRTSAIALDSGISSRVSRPYAKLLADLGILTHFYGGTPGDRLARAGYTNWTWAENIGSPSSVMQGMIDVQRFYQNEAPCRCEHYANLMNPAYDRVGIGVWVTSGRVRIVIDFYHP